MGNIKEYLDESIEIEEAKKTQRKKKKVSYSVIFSDGINFVVKKNTKNERIMAILPEKNQFYLKDTGKDPEPLTENSMYGFLSGLKAGESLDIPFCAWLDSIEKSMDFVRPFLTVLEIGNVRTLIRHGCFRFYPELFSGYDTVLNFFESANGRQLNFFEYMPRYVSDIRGVSYKEACDYMYRGLNLRDDDYKYPFLQDADGSAVFLSLIADWAGPETARQLFKNCVALDVCTPELTKYRYAPPSNTVVNTIKQLCLADTKKFVETATFGRTAQGHGFDNCFISSWYEYVKTQQQMFNGRVPDPYPDTLDSSKNRLNKVDSLSNRLDKAESAALLQAGKEPDDWVQALSSFTWDGDGFSVVPPENVEEIFMEGTCLTNFASKQKLAADTVNGKRTVLFLRRSGEKQKPFATILVENGEVKTILGRFNHTVAKDALDAVKEWAAYFGIGFPDTFKSLEELFPFTPDA